MTGGWGMDEVGAQGEGEADGYSYVLSIGFLVRAGAGLLVARYPGVFACEDEDALGDEG